MNTEFVRLSFMPFSLSPKWLVCLAVLMGGDLTSTLGAEGEARTYHVQLIRGNDEAKSPEPGARSIGSKLAKKLRPVFKWRNYWEIKYQKIEISSGKKARVRLSNGREVEIDLTDAVHRTVIAYQSGREVTRTTNPIGEGMTIIGGCRDTNSAWFIVVRPDAPAD